MLVGYNFAYAEEMIIISIQIKLGFGKNTSIMLLFSQDNDTISKQSL